MGMLMRTALLLPLTLLAPAPAFAANAVALDNSVFVERVTTDAAGRQRVRLEEPREVAPGDRLVRSEEHTSELQSLMRTSYAVFCLKKKHNRSAESHRIYKYHHKCLQTT